MFHRRTNVAIVISTTSYVRLSAGETTRKKALQKGVERMGAPHERAGATSAACGFDSSFLLRLAQSAGSLESAVLCGLACCQVSTRWKGRAENS
jgi:hypothetical protein